MPNDNSTPKEGVAQGGLQSPLPEKFSGWNKLFVKQGEEPAGWKNLSTTDQPAKDTKAVDAGFGGGGGGGIPAESTQTMLSPDGSQHFEIGLDKVEHAVKAGFYKAVHMVTPDGQHGFVPEHRADDALQAGFKHVNSK